MGIFLKEVDEAPQVDVKGFVGKEGKTVTLLRPYGDVDFNGIRMQVSSDGPFIDKGTKVQVIETQGTKIIVRAVEENQGKADAEVKYSN